MIDEQNRDSNRDGESQEPFRKSGSGKNYDPNSNWAAERRLDQGSGGTVPGIEGAPSGAGDGGFGPEGDYSSGGREGVADVQTNEDADRDALAKEAHELGRPKPGRATTGGSAADEPDAR